MHKFFLACCVFVFVSCTADPKQPTALTAEINGVPINYIITGDGPPLYLLHGGMESRDSFKHQIKALSDHFTVVAPDSREQGRSGRSPAQISYELMSQDVIALARELGHDKISVMGSSDGGITALTTARSHPGLIDKLVLAGASYHVSAYSDEMRDFIANYQWDGNTDPDVYPGIFIAHYLTGQENLYGFGALLAEMAVMWTTSPNFTRTEISEINAPTLVINGDHDDIDLGHTLSLYDALPNAELFVIPDGDHYALSKKPDLINSVTLEFLLKD